MDIKKVFTIVLLVLISVGLICLAANKIMAGIAVLAVSIFGLTVRPRIN